ncbi:MAG TPA: diguanylate cyclase [Solirubrobacteraceae bacterium]|nr:diguanylate cyclase [Solirubrobacteraceae bacterium]
MPPRRRRARPVADAPIDPLLARSDDLTKGWLLALLEQAPLDDAPAILAADLTRDGPRLCDAVVRAIADENDLRRLEAGGALTPLAARVGDMAGASGPAAVSRAVDALQAVIWSAVRDELRGADADLVSELTERLTLISELLRAAALERQANGLRAAPSPSAPAGPSTGTGPWQSGPPSPLGSPPPPPPPGPPGPPPPSSPWPGPPEAPPPVASSTAAGAMAGGPTIRRGGDDDAAVRSWPGDAARAGRDGEALWVGALDEEIQRAPGTPLSLLLAELEDADRLAAIETRAEASAALNHFAAAVRSAVRRQDILVCETDARAWIIARDTSRDGAYALAERIAAAVQVGRASHGAPLSASVGIAVLGEDGRTSAELLGAAEEARFAAEARGVVVHRLDGDDDDS